MAKRSSIPTTCDPCLVLSPSHKANEMLSLQRFSVDHDTKPFQGRVRACASKATICMVSITTTIVEQHIENPRKTLHVNKKEKKREKEKRENISRGPSHYRKSNQPPTTPPFQLIEKSPCLLVKKTKKIFPPTVSFFYYHISREEIRGLSLSLSFSLRRGMNGML